MCDGGGGVSPPWRVVPPNVTRCSLERGLFMAATVFAMAAACSYARRWSYMLVGAPIGGGRWGWEPTPLLGGWCSPPKAGSKWLPLFTAEAGGIPPTLDEGGERSLTLGVVGCGGRMSKTKLSKTFGVFRLSL